MRALRKSGRWAELPAASPLQPGVGTSAEGRVEARRPAGIAGGYEARAAADPVTVLLLHPRPQEIPDINDALRDLGCRVIPATSVSGALQRAAGDNIDVVVMPVNAPLQAGNDNLGRSGCLLAIEKLRSARPSAEIIFFHEADQAIDLAECCELILAGGRSFLDRSSPSFIDELTRCVDECSHIKRSYEDRKSDSLVDDIPGRYGMVGSSPAMQKVFDHVRKASMRSDAPVLITGESGTGKQLLAEAVHRLDEKRRGYPFIVVNCSAITATLAESELFGHKRGAFTGSVGDRLGFFRAADHGTIFLDEIGEMDIALQPKLLRVLQESRVQPVGADSEVEIDVRVIAASNRDVRQLIADGRFRMDLYQRLNVVPIRVPPLRERKEDILPLMKYFIRKHSHYYRGRMDGIDPRVLDAISSLQCDGNVRQIENLVRHVLLTKEAGNRIELSDLPRGIISRLLTGPDSKLVDEVADYLYERVTRDGMSITQVMDHAEKLLVGKVLAQTNRNQTHAARILKTTPRTIFNKIRKHGV